jgi:hypothetical protein
MFYAYIQTEPKDQSRLWAGAAELAEVNGRLFYNFLDGIKVAGIRPKRVLLQTGGKVGNPFVGEWKGFSSICRQS